jgi:hypothetical protein
MHLPLQYQLFLIEKKRLYDYKSDLKRPYLRLKQHVYPLKIKLQKS